MLWWPRGVGRELWEVVVFEEVGNRQSESALRSMISGRLPLPGVGAGVVLREFLLVALGAGVSWALRDRGV